MSDNSELKYAVKFLRDDAKRHNPHDYADSIQWSAADALEALAGEVEQWRAAFNKLQERALTKEQALADCTAERDRLKAALECVRQYVRGGPDHVSDEDITNIFRISDSALGDVS